MRLHRLEIEAFGPFATRTAIDFDTLSEAGLFLLSGATGAGKTSVLDAVCFALYGDVPGDRSNAKRLRCDQALPEVAPRVVLEVTLGERRFRIERSPAWERPKRRGTGLTTQQASVTMSELRSGAWSPLSSRLDETGDLVGRLVGMNLAQFTQVAMLPQGRFQTFLRAKSDERHQLLQQLFRTGRFAEVERWLRDRRLTLVRQDADVHQRVADVVSRVSETTGLPLPDHWDIADLRDAVDGDQLVPWVVELTEQARSLLESSREESDDAGRHEAAARSAAERARDEAAQRRRYDGAAQEQVALDRRADDHARDQERLDAAVRAGAVVPLLRHARSCGAAADVARDEAASALRALRGHVASSESTSPEDLDALVATATTAAAHVRAAVPRATRAVAASAELERAGRRLAEVDAEHARAETERAALPKRLARLRSDAEAARAARERCVGLDESATTVRERIEAHAVVATLRVERDGARQEWLTAREVSLGLKEDLLALQQARIEGMAAELAGALASGCSCPVCGSADHPAKAAAAPGAPDARAEKSARTAADNASMLEHAFAAKVHELEASLAGAQARAGDTPVDDLRTTLAALEEQGRATQAVAARSDAVAAKLADAEEAEARLARQLSELGAARARLDSAREQLAAEVESLQGEIRAILDDTDHGDLASLLAHHERTASLARSAASRREHAAAAERSSLEALGAADTAAREAGFDDADHAAGHALPQSEVGELTRAVDDHRRRCAAVRDVLAEPAAEALAGTDPPELSVIEAAHHAALERRDQASAALHVASARHQRLTGLRDDLVDLSRTWVPLRNDLELTAGLAGFVEGKSVDNQLKMRLSAYVLAYRLSQVVAAANERLAGMSDQRYSLEHTGRRGAGETRGGLSLLVRDDWSGETRDPATLSGGETFVVSLALALGLSDVVTQESGGARLDTLFVDEGFGSLDAETLDDVMDTLDSLRDGGRVVGLVSHVAEMRDRIPTQLVVTKARTGSTVRLRGC